VALLNEFKSVMESCVMPIQLHETELGAATVDETPQPKEEKKLSEDQQKVAKVKAYAAENKMDFSDATLAMAKLHMLE
jgi:hypothetical protein